MLPCAAVNAAVFPLSQLPQLLSPSGHAFIVTVPENKPQGKAQCSLLGAGVIAPGDVGIVAGTTAPVQVVLDRAHYDPAGKSLGSYHVMPGRWVLESNGGGMGYSLSLMARILFPDAPEPELRLLAEAAQSEAGAAGMLSTLGADVMNMRAPAMPMGHLSLGHMAYLDDPAPRRHLARALVEGCACGVRANLVEPGFVDTEFNAHMGEAAERIVARIPLRRPIVAEEIARAVLYLASSPSVTGATLRVDGGWTARM